MAKKEKDSRFNRRDFIKKGATAGVGVTALAALGRQEGQTQNWNRVADVVVIGSGAAGLPAAIRARDEGASVIVVDENFDVGGHAMISAGQVRLGGGTSVQKKFGIDDTPDMVYLENTRPDHPLMRYNDRKIVRAFADHNVEVYDFLVANGVKFRDSKPVNNPIDGTLTPRIVNTVLWSNDIKETINGSGGSGLARALEASARAKGVEILLNTRMTGIVRESPISGRVLGIRTTNVKDNTVVNIQARQAVIACTGGSSSNLVVRTIYDSRLTEEYQVGCEPYSRQSGDAEQLGMSIGASLGSTSNQRNEARSLFQKLNFIGCRYGYARWNPDSPVFGLAGASGIVVGDDQNIILVNVLGRRFFSEVTAGDIGQGDVQDYFAAAFSSAVVGEDGRKERIGGPIWAIFDADAVIREKWNPRPPFVDTANGYFFSADTLAALAAKLKGNPYQKVPMAPAVLEATVARYNLFVDEGKDADFGKPTPKYKIQKPPFYAAWATPILHDCYSGLRVNEKYQVVDVFGKVIPSFYCAGESASGITLHGLAKCIVGGYIAGKNSVLEPRIGS